MLPATNNTYARAQRLCGNDPTQSHGVLVPRLLMTASASVGDARGAWRQ